MQKVIKKYHLADLFGSSTITIPESSIILRIALANPEDEYSGFYAWVLEPAVIQSMQPVRILQHPDECYHDHTGMVYINSVQLKFKCYHFFQYHEFK